MLPRVMMLGKAHLKVYRTIKQEIRDYVDSQVAHCDDITMNVAVVRRPSLAYHALGEGGGRHSRCFFWFSWLRSTCLLPVWSQFCSNVTTTLRTPIVHRCFFFFSPLSLPSFFVFFPLGERISPHCRFQAQRMKKPPFRVMVRGLWETWVTALRFPRLRFSLGRGFGGFFGGFG